MEVVKNLGIISEKNEDSYEITGIASVEMLDRDNDIIFLDGLDLSAFKKNPTLFLQHWTWGIGAGAGTVTDLWVAPDDSGRKALWFKAILDKDDEDVQKVYSKLKKGISRGVSIGFGVKEYSRNREGGYDITKSELREISIVNIGANQGAYVTSVKSLIKSENPSFFDEDSEKNNKDTIEISKETIKEIVTESVKAVIREMKAEEKEIEDTPEEEPEINKALDDIAEFNGKLVKIIKNKEA